MGIVDDDNNFLELDNSEKQNPVYDNLGDEARLNLKAAADAEENNDENKVQNPLESEDKIVLAKPADCCQIRNDIYS